METKITKNAAELENKMDENKKRPISIDNGSFCCKSCNHVLPIKFQIRTEEYCYMCDPNITLDECLSDKPLLK